METDIEKTTIYFSNAITTVTRVVYAADGGLEDVPWVYCIDSFIDCLRGASYIIDEETKERILAACRKE